MENSKVLLDLDTQILRDFFVTPIYFAGLGIFHSAFGLLCGVLGHLWFQPEHTN